MFEEIMELTDEQRRYFFKAARTIFAYSDEEIEALCNPERMTSEIFEKCLETCIAMDDVDEFFDVVDSFPQLSKDCTKRIEETMDDLSEDLEKEMERGYQQLLRKIDKMRQKEVNISSEFR